MDDLSEIKEQLKKLGINNDLPDNILIDLLNEIKKEDNNEVDNENDGENEENEENYSENSENSENEDDNPSPIIFSSPSHPNPYYMSPNTTIDSIIQSPKNENISTPIGNNKSPLNIPSCPNESITPQRIIPNPVFIDSDDEGSFSADILGTKKIKPLNENKKPIFYHSYLNKVEEPKITKKIKENIISPKSYHIPTVIPLQRKSYSYSKLSPYKSIEKKNNKIESCHCQIKPEVPYTVPIGTSSSYIKYNPKKPNTGRCNKHDPVSAYQKMSKQWKKVPILNTKKRTPKTYKNVEQHKKTHPEIPDTYIPPPQKRRDEYRNVLRQKMVNGELITYNLFIIYSPERSSYL